MLFFVTKLFPVARRLVACPHRFGNGPKMTLLFFDDLVSERAIREENGTFCGTVISSVLSQGGGVWKEAGAWVGSGYD